MVSRNNNSSVLGKTKSLSNLSYINTRKLCSQHCTNATCAKLCVRSSVSTVSVPMIGTRLALPPVRHSDSRSR